jgi:hypothetical protein
MVERTVPDPMGLAYLHGPGVPQVKFALCCVTTVTST